MVYDRVVPLFNLYFNAMVTVWCRQCSEIGLPVLYKYGRKLIRDCTFKSRLLRVRVSEPQFADDLALYAVNCALFESAGRKFVQVGDKFGLTVLYPKTKGLIMGAVSEDDVFPVEVGSGLIKMV